MTTPVKQLRDRVQRRVVMSGLFGLAALVFSVKIYLFLVIRNLS
jgi:hypothetical protein